MKRTPAKVEKCPIIESIFEVRFTPNIDSNLVFPLLYSCLKDEFPNVETLPIFQIPEQLRNTDPNLLFQPHYKLHHRDNTNHVFQIGPRVLAFSFSPEYHGWGEFSTFTQKYLKIAADCGIIGSIQRIGFRVINFFESDIFADKTLDIRILQTGSDIPYEDTALKTTFSNGIYKTVCNIINCAQLTAGSVSRKGSVIDIDTFTTGCSDFFRNIAEYMDKAHECAKNTFFDLLSDSFIQTMNPIYES